MGLGYDAEVTTSLTTGVTPLSAYQRRLFWFLSAASFFEGFDYMALAQLLPDIRQSLSLSPEYGGLLVGFINIGMVLAYFLSRMADVWGRRRLLAVTVAGYTISSLLTGLTGSVAMFGLMQLLSRVFLTAEIAAAMVCAAEEYPAERRGMVVGVIQACSSLGAIVCAGVVPLLLQTPYGWRSVYFVGSVPLLLLAIARRNMRETARYEEQVIRQGDKPRATDLLRILRSPYRNRMLQLATIWGLTFFCTQSAILFWKEFAVSDRGFTAGQVGGSLTIAAVAAMPLVFATGKLLDIVGRRRGAVVVFLGSAITVVLAYSLTSRVGLTLALLLGIAGTSAMLSVLNTYTTELFPTELRGDAFGWANSLLGRLAAVFSPMLVGKLAASWGWGLAVSSTALGPLLALVLILMLLPETRGQELEQTSQLR